MLNKKVLIVLFGLLFLSFAIYFGLSANTVFAHHIIDEISVSRPMGMTIDEGLLYVSNFGKSGVSIINTTNDEIASVINSSSKGGIIDAVSTPDKIYLAPFKSGTIEVYDKKTENVSNIIKLPGGNYSTPTPLADKSTNRCGICKRSLGDGL
ncbi:hypothetical protein [Candidatus Nitrosocosmicus sp. T]